MNRTAPKRASNQRPLPWVTKREKIDSWPVFVEIQGIHAGKRGWTFACTTHDRIASLCRPSPRHSRSGYSLFLSSATPWGSREAARVERIWGRDERYPDGTPCYSYPTLPIPYPGGGRIGVNVDLINKEADMGKSWIYQQQPGDVFGVRCVPSRNPDCACRHGVGHTVVVTRKERYRGLWHIGIRYDETTADESNFLPLVYLKQYATQEHGSLWGRSDERG